MKTYKRICLKDYSIIEGDKSLKIKRGEEYITSEETDGKVTVFSTYWANVPISYFGGEIMFTK